MQPTYSVYVWTFNAKRAPMHQFAYEKWDNWYLIREYQLCPAAASGARYYVVWHVSVRDTGANVYCAIKSSGRRCVAFMLLDNIPIDMSPDDFDDVRWNTASKISGASNLQYPPASITQWKCPYYAGNMDIGLIPWQMTRSVFGDDIPEIDDKIIKECNVIGGNINDAGDYIWIAVIPRSGYDGGVLARSLLSLLGKSTNLRESLGVLGLCVFGDSPYVGKYDWIYVWIETIYYAYNSRVYARGLTEEELWADGRSSITSLICPGVASRGAASPSAHISELSFFALLSRAKRISSVR